MSYDDMTQQNQQFYMQRIQTQPQQGMVMPILQQQQQRIRQQTYGMMPQPHQQIVMRMPTLQEDHIGHYQHQQQIRDFIQSLPTNVQNQINSERDPERRRQIFQAFKQQQQIYEQQMGIRTSMNLPPQRMPISQAQGIMYASGGQQMVQQPSGQQMLQQPSGQQMVQQPSGQQMLQQPSGQQMVQQPTSTTLQRVSSQGSFGQTSGQPQQMSQIYMQNQINQIRQPMQPMPISQPYVQQHFQSQATQHPQLINKQSISTNTISTPGQQRNMTSEVLPGNVAMNQMRKTQSTQIIQQLPSGNLLQNSEENLKSSTENIRLQSTLEQQPRSAGTPHLLNAQQHHNEAENPDYKSLLEQLCKYQADVKKLLDRMILDNVDKEAKLRSSLVNVIQVMEGTRKTAVTSKLLGKLLNNVRTVLYNKNIAKSLYSAAENLSKFPVIRDYSSIANEKELPFSDSWKNVRHLQIKVPEHINQLIRESKLAKENKILKRKRHGLENDSDKEPPFKRSSCTGMDACL